MVCINNISQEYFSYINIVLPVFGFDFSDTFRNAANKLTHMQP